MTIKKAREILKSKAKNLTDKEIQALIDRLRPLARLAAQEAIKEFNLDSVRTFDKLERSRHTDCRVRNNIGIFNGLPQKPMVFDSRKAINFRRLA